MTGAATGTAHDLLGDREVPADAYCGVQTLRGRESFHFTGIPMSSESAFVKAVGCVKKAAAMANRDPGVSDPIIARAIIGACDRRRGIQPWRPNTFRR